MKTHILTKNKKGFLTGRRIGKAIPNEGSTYLEVTTKEYEDFKNKTSEGKQADLVKDGESTKLEYSEREIADFEQTQQDFLEWYKATSKILKDNASKLEDIVEVLPQLLILQKEQKSKELYLAYIGKLKGLSKAGQAIVDKLAKATA